MEVQYVVSTCCLVLCIKGSVAPSPSNPPHQAEADQWCSFALQLLSPAIAPTFPFKQEDSSLTISLNYWEFLVKNVCYQYDFSSSFFIIIITILKALGLEGAFWDK